MKNPGKILAVDDQAVVLMNVSAVLEAAGYDVHTASDADSALKKVAEVHPDLILVDLKLGDTDGAELVSHLRDICPDSVFAVLSACSDAQSVVRAMQSGAHDYLIKPFSTEDLELFASRCFQHLRLTREKSRAEAELRRSNQELRRMNTRLRLMVDTVKNIRAGESPEEDSRTALTEFARAMRANGGSLYVCRGGQLVRLHSLDPEHTPTQVPLPPDPGSVLARVFETRRPVFIEEIESEMVLSGSGWTGYRNGSVMSFPLLTAEGPVEGVVSLHNPADPPFTKQDLDLGIIFSSLVLETLHTSQATERLRESEERYRLLLEKAGDAIFTTEGMSVTDCNDKTLELLRCSREEMMDGPPYWFFPEYQLDGKNSVEEMERIVSEVIAGKDRRFEWLHRRLDGTEFIGDVTLTPVSLGDRTIVLCILRDITEEKESRRRVEESEARYRDFFEHTPAFNILVSLDQEILSVNQAAAEAVGCTKPEIIGTNLSDWIVNEHREALAQLWPKLQAGEVGPQQEWHIRTRDGAVRMWYARSGDARKIYEGGKVLGLLLQLVDVTELRAAEVREREQREQLYQASKLASLGTLLSGVAHEINNPNNFIRMSTDNLRDFWNDALVLLDRMQSDGQSISLAGLPYSKAREIVPKMMHSINEGSERIERLVNDLRDFAVSGGAGEYTVADLNDLLENSLNIIRSTVNSATGGFSVSRSDAPALIRCSKNQIEQTIMNLITNSCQALTSRDQQIRVRVERRADAQSVELAVEDEGRGIPEDQIHHITDPFYTTRRAEGGTGLGLAVAHRIASDHGGILEFSSIHGQGTTAVLRLPAYEPGFGK